MKYYTLNHAACVMPRWLRQTLLVMKITTLILFAALMQVSAAGLAQKLTLQKNKTSLRELFAEIKKQTSYNVVWDSKIIENAKPLTVNYKNTEIETVLDEVLPSRDLEYNISDRTIVIKQKEASLIDRIVARFQTIDVRGRVVDSLGNGLAGATVSVKNGKGSTSTDNLGNFYLRNVEEGGVLVVNYLGYVTKEQAISKDFTYVTLQQSTSKLDEIQIMGYGRTSRRLNTGTITTVTNEQLLRQPVSNPLLALQGRVPNLMISPTTGNFGSSIKIQLRGQNSLTGLQSEPLIVIDGIPFTNNIAGDRFGFLSGNPQSGNFENKMSALSFLNPADVESINVLSDADATSIYGSRGGSGVILITTKKGKVGKTKVNFNISSGFNEMPGKLDLLNTEQYLEMRKEAYRNDNLPVPNRNSSVKNGNNYDLTVWSQERYTDWQEVLLGGKGHYTNSSISISGGSTNIQYIISSGYNQSGNLLPGDFKSQSGTGNLSLTGNSNDQRFKIGINATYTSNKNFTPAQDFAYLAVVLPPNAPELFKPNGDLNWEQDYSSPQVIKPPTWMNPFAKLLRTTTAKTNLMNVSSEISYEILPGFSLKTNMGFSKVQLNSINIDPLKSRLPDNLANETGVAIRTHSFSNSSTVEPQLNFIKTYNKATITALLGGSYQCQSMESEGVYGSGYSSDAFLLDLNQATFHYATNSSSQYKYAAVFGRVNFNWDQSYILNLSVRRDGSSRFGPNRKFGNFWSIASAWIFSNDKIFKENIPWLSFGKVRGSYGSAGNDGIGDYQYLELYRSLPNGTTYQGITPIESQGLNNPYFGWEDVKKLELGIEVGFLNDRIILRGSRWQTRSSNQLGEFKLPAMAGNTHITKNIDASLQNSGWDTELSTKNLENPKFTWSTSINIGIQRNKILSLPEGFAGTLSSGYPVSTFRAPDLIGQPFSGVQYTTEYRGVNSDFGKYQFKDELGNTVVPSSTVRLDYSAKRIITDPKFAGGISNDIRFGAISINVFFQFSKQKGRNYLFDNAFWANNGYPGMFKAAATGTSAVRGNQPVEIMNRWRSSGDITNIQRFSQTNPSINDVIVQSSDASWVDASFIRLKNAAVTYEVPAKFIKRIKLQTLRFFINGQNLLLWTNYKGLDPETQSVSTLPQLRTVTAGLAVGL